MGAWGTPVMDPLYTRDDFEAAVVTLRQPVQGRSSKITMKSVLEGLLRTPEPWTSEAFLALLRGDQGSELRVDAVDAVCCGFEVTRGYYSSLVSACIVDHKLELLAAVAALGLPDTKAPSAAGSTTNGAWMDLLCSTQAGSAIQEGRHTLPARINSLASIHPEASSFLIDLLLEHDPSHRDIELIEPGTEVHAIYLQAVLCRRLNNVTTTSTEDSTFTLARRPARRNL